MEEVGPVMTLADTRPHSLSRTPTFSGRKISSCALSQTWSFRWEVSWEEGLDGSGSGKCREQTGADYDGGPGRCSSWDAAIVQ